MWNTNQNHWVSRLCPLIGILNTRKTKRFGNWICFRLQVRWGRHLLCWVLQKELTSITAPVSENFCFLVTHNSGRWAKSRNQFILSVMQKHHNPLDSTWEMTSCMFDNEGRTWNNCAVAYLKLFFPSTLTAMTKETRSKLAQAVKLQICIRLGPVSKLSQDTDYSEFSHLLPILPPPAKCHDST
jgi:hypothetical protein